MGYERFPNPSDEARRLLSRRTLLTRAGVAAGAAGATWVVPSVLTLGSDAALASAQGCEVCPAGAPPGPNLVTNGTGSTLTGWSNVTNLTSTGTVFRATSSTAGTADQVYDLTSACQSRFTSANNSPMVTITLAANLAAGGNDATSVTATFHPNTGGLGTALGSLQVTTPGTNPISNSTTVPSGTKSIVVALSAGGGNGGGGGNKGTIDTVTLTLGTC